MDYIEVASILNEGLLTFIVEQLGKVTPVKEEEKITYVRLVEAPYKVTAENERIVRSAVTAHIITEYANRTHSVKLEEDIPTMLDWVLEICYEEAGIETRRI